MFLFYFNTVDKYNTIEYVILYLKNLSYEVKSETNHYY